MVPLIVTGMPPIHWAVAGVGIAAVTLLLTLLQVYLDYRREVAAIERRMSEIESGYVQSLGEGLWNLDRRQLELQVDGILRLPAIRFVEVREVTDRPDPMVVSAGSHQEGAVRRHEFPLLHAFHGTEQQLGLLSVEATLNDVYRELFHTATVVLVSQGAAIFLVSFFILFIVRGLITRHIGAIARYVGRYDVRRPPPPLRLARPPRRRTDELDELVGAFNSMSASLQAACGDGRYNDKRFLAALQRRQLVLEVKGWPAGAKGFVLIKKLWIVERTFAWLGFHRRLSKDYERTVASSETRVRIAALGMMLRRLTRKAA